MDTLRFHIGHWEVNPTANQISHGKRKRTIEPRAMDVLLLLCQHYGEVLSADTIIQQCWPAIDVGDNPVHKAITQLRRALDDKATQPTYIETIRKRGYRVIADVTFLRDEQTKAYASTWTTGSPYPGLSAFTAQQAQVFFGRASAIDSLMQKLALQQKSQHMLSVILGASGSGKSSLVHAGLLPKLNLEAGYNGLHVISDCTLDAADIRHDNIYQELASAMLDWEVDGEPLLAGYSAQSLAEKLISEPEQLRIEYEQRLTRLITPQDHTQQACVLVFDRLEAVLGSDSLSTSQKTAFFHVLDSLATGQSLMVLLLCRNDFYPQLSQFSALMRNKDRGGHFDLQPPSAIELSQIIRLPAVAANLSWEQHATTGVSLDEQLCIDAVHHADGLPLLQYTLQELYLQRQDNQLRFSVYASLGGVEGAIGRQAEMVYQSLSPSVQSAFAAVFSRLINLNQQDEQLTSRSVQWIQLQTAHEKAFVETMVEHRLFVSQLHQGEACFNVAHEALLRRWQRVSDWVTQHHIALRQKNRLAQQTQQWLNDGQSKAYLLAPGKPLTDALALLSEGSVSLSEQENALIRQSVAQQNKKRWLSRAIVAALACLTAVSFTAMLSSQHAEALAERKRLEAEDLMGFMIGDFADTLRNVKRMDLLDGISQRALAYVEASQHVDSSGMFAPDLPPPSFNLRFQHALSLQAVAEVRYYRDDLSGALEIYQQAESRFEPLLVEQPAHFDLLKAAGANAFWLGQIAYDEADYARSKKGFQQYLQLSQQMVSEFPDSQDARLELAYANNSLGSVMFKSASYDEAIKYFTAALVLRTQQTGDKDVLTVIDEADTHSWLSSAQLHLGDIAQAKAQLIKASSLLAKVNAQQPGNANVLESYAYVLVRQSELNNLAGEWQTSLNVLHDARKVIEQALAQDPQNSQWIDAKNLITTRTALTLSYRGDMADARKLIAGTGDMAANSGRTLDIITTYQNLGMWHESEVLLRQLNNEAPFNETLIDDPLSDFTNTQRYSRFLMAQSRQFYNEADTEAMVATCKTLTQLTNSATTISHQPDLVIAKVFAATCMDKSEDVTEDIKILSSGGIKLPVSLTIFDKD